MVWEMFQPHLHSLGTYKLPFLPPEGPEPPLGPAPPLSDTLLFISQTAGASDSGEGVDVYSALEGDLAAQLGSRLSPASMGGGVLHGAGGPAPEQQGLTWLQLMSPVKVCNL